MARFDDALDCLAWDGNDRHEDVSMCMRGMSMEGVPEREVTTPPAYDQLAKIFFAQLGPPRQFLPAGGLVGRMLTAARLD